MASMSPVHRGADGSLNRADNPMAHSAALDFRLRFANRIVEESWRERKAMWSHDDIGMMLLDLLDDELSFDWSQRDALDKFKEYLALAYVAAGDVLPASQRTF